MIHVFKPFITQQKSVVSFVPTYMREGNQFFYQSLIPPEQELIHFITHDPDGRAALGLMNRVRQENISLVPLGISNSRQFAVDSAISADWDYVAMFDDDLHIAEIHCTGPDRYKYVKAHAGLERSLTAIVHQMETHPELGVVGYAHAQEIPRQDCSKDFSDAPRRFWAAHVWRVSALKDIRDRGVRFTDATYSQDFHMHLAFLHHGWDSCVSQRFGVIEKLGTNADGGCRAAGRSPASQSAAAKWLRSRWPDYVTLRAKTHSGFSEEYFDMTVRWAKARRHGETQRV